MRSLMVLAACVAWVVSAGATIDPDPDQIGMYFDLDADEVCLDADSYGTFDIYVIITNPTAASVQSVSFSFCFDNTDFSSGMLSGPVMHWYGEFADTTELFSWCEDGRQINFWAPLPFVGSNVPVVRLEYGVLFGVPEGGFTLGPFRPLFSTNSYLEYEDAEGVVYELGVSSGDPELPVAFLNGPCDIVSTEGAAWGAVKALYR